MNDNTVDVRIAFKKAMQDAFRAGRALGLKESIDLIALHGKAADTQSSMNLCVVMAGSLVRTIDEPIEFPEYMR